jgi:hypothetical protein
MSCTNGINQKNKKVEIDTILANDIVNALLEMDSTFSTNDFLYSKFLPYDNETESPVICWEKDSFSNRSVYEVPPPPSKSKFKIPWPYQVKLQIHILSFYLTKRLERFFLLKIPSILGNKLNIAHKNL